jgi:hypothetical protein
VKEKQEIIYEGGIKIAEEVILKNSYLPDKDDGEIIEGEAVISPEENLSGHVKRDAPVKNLQEELKSTLVDIKLNAL